MPSPNLCCSHCILSLHYSNAENACNALTVNVGNNSCNRSTGCNDCQDGKLTNVYPVFICSFKPHPNLNLLPLFI